MKRIFIATMLALSLSSSLSATGYYESFCSRISNIGKAIEGVNNVPIIGKPTNLLPIAVVATSLKDHPMQTLAVLTALGAYVLSCNQAVREMVAQYHITDSFPWINRNTASMRYQGIDESIFVFDGDEDDVADIDEDLLGLDLLDDEEDGERKSKRRENKRAIL